MYMPTLSVCSWLPKASLLSNRLCSFGLWEWWHLGISISKYNQKKKKELYKHSNGWRRNFLYRILNSGSEFFIWCFSGNQWSGQRLEHTRYYANSAQMCFPQKLEYFNRKEVHHCANQGTSKISNFSHKSTRLRIATYHGTYFHSPIWEILESVMVKKKVIIIKKAFHTYPAFQFLHLVDNRTTRNVI